MYVLLGGQGDAAKTFLDVSGSGSDPAAFETGSGGQGAREAVGGPGSVDEDRAAASRSEDEAALLEGGGERGAGVGRPPRRERRGADVDDGNRRSFGLSPLRGSLRRNGATPG